MDSERQSLLRRATQTRELADRTRQIAGQLPSALVCEELQRYADQLDVRARDLEHSAAANGEAMTLWRLGPRAGRSGAAPTGWAGSLYDGAVGPVVVRARTAHDARALAAQAFDRDRARPRGVEVGERSGVGSGAHTPSPWMRDAETWIEPCVDGRFETAGAAMVLHPTREQVTPRSLRAAGDQASAGRRAIGR